MSILILIGLLALLHGYLFYVRHIYFYRTPHIKDQLEEDTITSPVDGRLVYVHDIEIPNGVPAGYATAEKRGRTITIDGIMPGSYYHIGIYLSPLSNHHILSMFPKGEQIRTIEITGKLYDMLSVRDMIFPLKSLLYKNWFARKLEEFIAYNQRVLVEYPNRQCYMAIIMDKYVNRYRVIDEEINGRHCMYFVHRGSQCDLFLPKENWRLCAEVGDRVSFDTPLALRTKALNPTKQTPYSDTANHKTKVEVSETV